MQAQAAPQWATELVPEVLQRLPDLSARLCDAIELRSSESLRPRSAIGAGEPVPYLEPLTSFVELHHLWVVLCIAFAPGQLPRALAPLHGLESWSAALRSLDAAATGEETPQWRGFMEARAGLQALRTRIASLDAVLAQQAAAPGGPAHAKAAAAGEHTRTVEERAAVYERERQALRAYTGARQRLGASGARYAALQRPTGLSVEELGGRLGPRERLVLCLGRPAGQHPLALVVLPGGRHVLVQLAVFWRPLLEAPDADLTGAPCRLHIVIAPDHHGLPLEHGNPGVAAYYYCGLPACFQQRDRPCRPACDAAMDVVTDPAIETASPIPFVDVEAQLVEELQPPGRTRRRSARELLDAPPSPRLLLSCHGTTVGSAGLRHGVLQLDAAAQTSLDAGQVAGLQGALGEVWISACLGGVVASRGSGDPLGLVSELQMRGVSTVIACRAPVHDFYMPLLAALYWHGRVRHPERLPETALADAKDSLRRRVWPESLLDTLMRVYRHGMDALLLRAAHRAGLCRWMCGPGISVPSRPGIRCQRRSTPRSHAGGVSRRTGACELIGRCLASLFDGRGAHADATVQAEIDAAILHVCAVTVCFGGAHADVPGQGDGTPLPVARG